jgi:mycothiol synthase
MKPLVMIRETLTDLPTVNVPAGYSIRGFVPGDEYSWERIVAASFETPRSFQAIMREDPSFVQERILFVVKDNVPVGTAAAWYHPLWGAQYGYLHFVGVEPRHRGKRLGYWVSLAALYRFVTEGRTMAVLETEDFRVPAIRTYLRLGFRPQLTGQSMDAWTRLAQSVPNWPEYPDDSWINDITDQQ